MKRKARRRRPQQRNIIIRITDAGNRLERQLLLQQFNAFSLGTAAPGNVNPFFILESFQRRKLRVDLRRNLLGMSVGFSI